MLPALLVLAGVFALLFLVRLGAARRERLIYRWPAIILAAAAGFALIRGALWPAVALAAASGLFWMFGPDLFARRAPAASSPTDSPELREARRVLGVGPSANAGEIRRAYRDQMTRAHPDRGGSHEAAARLTAARDLLLKRKP